MGLATQLSCGDNPVAPDPPGPTLTCPAAQETLGRNGQPAVVTFDPPVAQGGLAPVSVTCAPASGSAFPIGTTTVTCTARDSRARAATCNFSVVVTRVPTISQVDFVAFGDSITEGTTSPDPTILTLNPPDSYPFKLQALLTSRYADQIVTVFNEGKAGERVSGKGEARFKTVIDARRPDVVLLLDGANDLLAYGNQGKPRSAIPVIIDALENMINYAKARRVRVMLATFPPQDEDGSRGAGAPAVPDLNEAIADLARTERIVLVDLFEGLDGTPVGSIGVDGLHPTASGYTKIAQIWFDAIREEYEDDASARPVLRMAPAMPLAR